MAARRKEAEHAAPRASGVRPALAGRHAAAPSPALELQARLEADFGRQDRWHPAATLGFVLATCGGFWSLVAWGVSSLAR